MSADDLKSFIKKNILAVITDETACAFSWTGQHNNIEIRYFQFTKLLEGKRSFFYLMSRELEKVLSTGTST